MTESVADRRAAGQEVRFSHVDVLTELGIGIAVGMLAGTTGTHGSARGRMTLLAAVIGLVAGFLLEGPLGALLGLVGATLGCLVISDVVFGASRREGSGAGALGFIVALVALVVVAIALLAPAAVLVVAIALLWLGISRHRRAQRKHAGLRVLR
jgi:formate-dependent nitrite reductase membrane component NrfD